MANVDSILQEIDAKMNNITAEIFAQTQQNLIDDGKIDTGSLLQTGNMDISGFLHKRIIYPASHAEVVNYGRTPGMTMPPVDALTNWVRRKLQISDEKEIRSTAFAIAKSIEQRGIQPTFFIENAIETVMGDYR
jgi:hypothetical protein